MRLVYLSPVPWASFAQRPHKFVEWFHARHGGEVFWVDPYPTRLPKIGDFRRKKSTVFEGGASSAELPHWLSLIQPRALFIEPLPVGGALNRFLWRDLLNQVDQFLSEPNGWIGIGKPSALALQILVRHPAVPAFYDAMDDFPAFYEGLSRQAMKRRECEVASKVSKILVSSTALAERFDCHKSKVLMALNACAIEMLSSEKLISSSTVQPVLGYVGTIGHWFDWPMVFALANANPMARIRLIGPLYSPPPAQLLPNIELLPPCDHATAMLAMQDFSVGLIPFKQTALTESVDPIKYYEYRALGLPIVSTRFGEMAFREKQSGVFFVADQSDLSGLVARALEYQSNKNEIQKFRNENSWGARFDACDLFG